MMFAVSICIKRPGKKGIRGAAIFSAFIRAESGEEAVKQARQWCESLGITPLENWTTLEVPDSVVPMSYGYFDAETGQRLDLGANENLRSVVERSKVYSLATGRKAEVRTVPR